MPEPKWTPGPWRLRDQDGPPINDVLSESGDLLATAYPEHYRLSDPRRASSDAILRSYAVAEANARLIAAAPELYGALNAISAVFARCGSREDYDNAFRQAGIAALAKARGDTDV